MKKVVKFIFIPVAAVIVIVSAFAIHYLCTTLSASACIDYCIENTSRGATEFSCFGDGRYAADYKYFVAVDGDTSKPQEIFVFKRKFFGPIAFNRYSNVIMHSSQNYSTNDTNKFGALEFVAENDEGEKENGSTLIFFGANKDSHITEYEYTLTVREGSNVYKGRVVNGDRIWFVKFFDLGDFDENTKKIVSDVKFYDEDGNFVDGC